MIKNQETVTIIICNSKTHYDDEGTFWKVSRNEKVNEIKNIIIYYAQKKSIKRNWGFIFWKLTKSDMLIPTELISTYNALNDSFFHVLNFSSFVNFKKWRFIFWTNNFD